MKVSNDKLIIPDPKFDKNDGDGRRQTQYVKLCVGYPLVCWSTKHHNTTEGKVSAFGNIENSSRFEVVELRKETFIVKRVLKIAQQEKYKHRQDLMDAAENERFEFRYVDTGGTQEKTGFHRVFRPGFCITVHQSQGDTFNQKYTIYDWDFLHMKFRGRYVSFTRTTRREFIQISTQCGTCAKLDEIERKYGGAPVARKVKMAINSIPSVPQALLDLQNETNHWDEEQIDGMQEELGEEQFEVQERLMGEILERTRRESEEALLTRQQLSQNSQEDKHVPLETSDEQAPRMIGGLALKPRTKRSREEITMEAFRAFNDK